MMAAVTPGEAGLRSRKAWYPSGTRDGAGFVDVTAAISPIGSWSSVPIGALSCIVLCAMGQARPGPWRNTVSRLIGLVLAGAISSTDGLPDP
jgi:hypothetical protein